jgi:hypothetical protein
MMGEAKQRPCVFIDAEQGERFHVVLFTIVGSLSLDHARFQKPMVSTGVCVGCR